MVRTQDEADNAGTAGFARTPITWLAYGALASYAFCLYALGPVLAFLHTELHLSYTLTSLHSTLWAAGTVGAGLGFQGLTGRVGRRRVVWLSAACTSVGALLFVAGHWFGLTLMAATVLGTGGSFLQTSASALLADSHGAWRDRALVEANIGASGTAVAAPALLGALAATAPGWRVGLLVPVLTLGCLYLAFRRSPLPSQPHPAHPISAGRARDLWGPCVLVALAVGIEFCIVFDGIQLLSRGIGLATADAARLMSLFFVGELVGRVVGAGLIRRPGGGRGVIGAALAISLGGFMLLWTSDGIVPSGAGLFLTGLGIANLYPLTLGRALAAGRGRTDLAAAMSLLAVGVSVAVAPLALGILADQVGIQGAFVAEPALIAVAAVLLALAKSRE